MDNLNDSLKALEDGEKILGNTLLVQVRVNFAPTHNGQPELGTISNWLSEHGFSFYRLNNLQHSNPSSEQAASVQQQATQLACEDAIFVPAATRLIELTDNKRLKLEFLRQEERTEGKEGV